MRIAVKQIDKDIFFDSKNHWKKIGDRMYGFDPLRGTIYPMWKKEGDFEEILPPSQKHLKSSQERKREEPRITTDTTKIAPRDIDKPGKYVTEREKAYQALVGGD